MIKGKLVIYKQAGQMKQADFKKWFCKQFPKYSEDWESYYKSVGGKVKKPNQTKSKSDNKGTD